MDMSKRTPEIQVISEDDINNVLFADLKAELWQKVVNLYMQIGSCDYDSTLLESPIYRRMQKEYQKASAEHSRLKIELGNKIYGDNSTDVVWSLSYFTGEIGYWKNTVEKVIDIPEEMTFVIDRYNLNVYSTVRNIAFMLNKHRYDKDDSFVDSELFIRLFDECFNSLTENWLCSLGLCGIYFPEMHVLNLIVDSINYTLRAVGIEQYQ